MHLVLRHNLQGQEEEEVWSLLKVVPVLKGASLRKLSLSGLLPIYILLLAGTCGLAEAGGHGGDGRR
jgi:hypothetical protein